MIAGLVLPACAPHFEQPANSTAAPRLTGDAFISFDGSRLPLRTWFPETSPEKIFIALHGYNDYADFIDGTAAWFAGQGIGFYAFDQRGFGRAPNRGTWPGRETMGRDLRTIITLVHERHPGIPLYLLGDSMGGAVIMASDSPDDPLPVEGVVLAAPAVWSRETMPFYQRWLLAAAVRIMPRVCLSGRGLNITPSDNLEMLKDLGRDPLVIKESRIDAIYGLTNLMDAAYAAASRFDQNVLYLYGAKDEIIPTAPVADVFRKRLAGNFSHQQRLLVYENGYHMLLRDLQAEVVWRDILSWLDSPRAPFPSVKQQNAREISDKSDIADFIFSAKNKEKTADA